MVVTQLRNPEAGAAPPPDLIVFICEVDCPGASGVSADVFHELTTVAALEFFAVARQLNLLIDISSAQSTWVRRSLEGVSLGEIAHFAERAEGPGDREVLQLAALPLLRLIPTSLLGRRRAKPTARWGKDWDALTSGTRRASLKAAAAALGLLGGDQRARAEQELIERFLPEAIVGDRSPVAYLVELAKRTADLAAGDFEAAAELVGLSGDLLKKCLYKGEGAVDALVREIDEDDSGEEGDEEGVGPLDDEGPKEISEEEVLHELERDDLQLREDNVYLGDDYQLPDSRDTSFIWMLAEKAPSFLWSDGGMVIVREVEPFLGEHSSVEAVTVARVAPKPAPHSNVPPELASMLTDFQTQRDDLLGALRAHLTSHTTRSEEGSEEDESSECSLQEALRFMEGHQLLLVKQLPEECERYVRSYLRLIERAPKDQLTPPEIFQWLANLDVALYQPPPGAIQGSTNGVFRARLLPTHPLVIERARLHHELSGPPPELPSRLALRVPPSNLDLYPSSRGGFYAKVDQIRPESDAVQRAALRGLDGAWALLQRARMTKALGVHLQSLSDPLNVALAVAERFRELVDLDQDADGIGHLEITWSEEAALPGIALDRKELLRRLPELASTPKGEGTSIEVGRVAVSQADYASHLLVTETYADLDPAQQQAIYHPTGAEVWVRYEPSPRGVVTRITLQESEAEELAEAFACKLNGDGQRAAGAPRQPQGTPNWLVRAMVSRGGWPEDPRETDGVLSYEVDERGNYSVIATDPVLLLGELKRSLERAYPFLFHTDSGLDLKRLREGAFVMRSLGRVQLDLLDRGSAESTKVRGSLGQLKALLVLREEAGERCLILDLDCSEGLALARAYKRSFGSRERADLLIIEQSAVDQLALRVIELKTHKRCPGTGGRAVLAKQALVTRSRLQATLPVPSQELTRDQRSQLEALRRLCWMGASHQREAWSQKDLLESLDAALAGREDAPRVSVTAECWVIPEEASMEPDTFLEEVQDLDPFGKPREAMREVTFRIVAPLPPPSHETEKPAPPEAPVPPLESVRLPPCDPRPASSAPPAPKADGRSRGSQNSTEEAPADALAQGPLELILGATLDAVPLRVQPGKLDNRNIMISGSPGTGKTQLIKSLILQLREQGYPVIALDFKNDFASDREFCRQAELEPAFVLHDGLPFNPLIPPVQVHPGTGEASISVAAHVQGLAGTLRATYGLGPQQENKLKKSIRKAYENHGIKTTGSAALREDQAFPTFQEVGDKLLELDELAYSRLDPLFDLELFRKQAAGVSFDQLLSKAAVLDLSALPSDEAKAALAKFFLIAAHSYYNPLPQVGDARQFFVFDEAHRVMDEPKFLQFIRECRAYGVGTVVASQNPTDFSKEVSASLALRVIHGNGADAERVKGIARLVGLEGQERRIRSLTKFKAIAQYAGRSATFINTLHYPALLVLKALWAAQEGMTENDLQTTPGLDPSKASVSSLLEHLESMGLVALGDGRWVARKDSA